MDKKDGNNICDSQLLKQMGDGEQYALELLYDRYYHPLCNFSFQYVRDVMLTEEIVSDVFLKIWLKRETIDINTNFKAYIFTATRNQTLNCLRKEKRKHLNIDEVDNIVEDYSYSPDRNLIKNESKNRIENFIHSLPPRRARVFRLSRIEGFTYKEIAQILSISVHTVQNHMVQAIKQVSKAFIEK